MSTFDLVLILGDLSIISFFIYDLHTDLAEIKKTLQKIEKKLDNNENLEIFSVHPKKESKECEE